MEKSTKKSFLDTLIGVKEPKMETMEHSQVLKQNLTIQIDAVEAEIVTIKAQLAKKKEYLAKLEGGIEVLEELSKNDHTYSR
jgi:cell division protein FtsB